jgi:hypothetical protein
MISIVDHFVLNEPIIIWLPKYAREGKIIFECMDNVPSQSKHKGDL